MSETLEQNVGSPSGVQRERIHSRYRLSPGQYQLFMALVKREQNGLCYICKKPGIDEKHETCHDKSCKDPGHWVGVHRHCNQSELNRQRAARSAVSVKREREETRNISWEASRSLELGPTFDKELRRLLAESALDRSENPWIPTVKNVENRLAKICGCAQATVSRWIEREATTPEGDYALSDKTVSDHRRKRTAQIIGLKIGMIE